MIELKRYSAHSEQGPYLQINEDSIEIDLVNNIYLILDGFGGSGVGDKAVGGIKENIKKFYGKIGSDPDATMPFFHSHKYMLEGNALINSMNYAHSVLKKENQEKAMSERGGASVIAASQSESVLTLVSVGNCMACLYSKGNLKPICIPNSFEFLAKDSFVRHFQTMPLSAFGLFDDLDINVREIRPNVGDKLIFLTDGAYARIDYDELKNILQGESKFLQDKTKAIFDLNNSRGNLDNQSALILQF